VKIQPQWVVTPGKQTNIWKREYFLIATVHFYAMNNHKADGKFRMKQNQ
jgi:hypothetical protein